MKTKVALHGMKFYAFHGYYDFERRIGSNYVVDIDTEVHIDGDPHDQIDETVNYEDLYQICKKYMGKDGKGGAPKTQSAIRREG